MELANVTSYEIRLGYTLARMDDPVTCDVFVGVSQTLGGGTMTCNKLRMIRVPGNATMSMLCWVLLQKSFGRA